MSATPAASGDLGGRATSTAGLVATEASTSWSRSKPTGKLRNVLALDDLEQEARRHLPRAIYGFISGAAETDSAHRGSLGAYADYGLVPRVLVDASCRNQTTTLFGKTYSAPFGIAPMGAAALAAYRGDLVLAQAAKAAGIPMITSASSLIRMEEICPAGSPWYQAYQPGEPDRILSVIDRVEAAGYEAFVLTVDVPVAANRENNVRNGYSLPLKMTPRLILDGLLHPGWLLGTWLKTHQQHGMPHFENMDAGRGPPVLSQHLERQVGRRDQLAWEHVALIRKRWKGPLIIKGLLAREDARLAREHGVDGIMVSNHGGRQLDYAQAPLHALPGVVAEAGDMTIMLDGGIRRGTDVLKALALGAKFVFVGRPMLYAAAIAGEPGVAHAIALLAEEIDRDMALMGVTDLASIGPNFLTRPNSAHPGESRNPGHAAAGSRHSPG